MSDRAIVTLSLDVEEEGLFTGQYNCLDAPVENVAYLERISPLVRRGARPTFFCAHSVLSDSRSCSAIKAFLPDIEIGAHLHHWNTPPLVRNIPESGILDRVPANLVPLELFESKLSHTLKLAADAAGAPATSFRMGRWDMQARFYPVLAKLGITCDASVRPLHVFAADAGPDHFAAPPDPYWIATSYGRILVAPQTSIPLMPFSASFIAKSGGRKALARGFRHWGVLSLLPVQHPLWLMKKITDTHLRRGGKVLSLSWHSSEMMPGATPHMKTEASIKRFLNKVTAYLDWLEDRYSVTYAMMRDLARENFPAVPHGPGDWRWQPSGSGGNG